MSRHFRTERVVSLWLQHVGPLALVAPEAAFPSQSSWLPYLSLSIHAALRDFVGFLRAVRVLFIAAAASFLGLGPALTTDGNPGLGCFGVR